MLLLCDKNTALPPLAPALAERDRQMTRSPAILVLGHHGCGARQVRVHHIPIAGETVVAWDFQIIKDGGKGSHQAIVIGRLGGEVGFIGKIPTDKQAEDARQWLIDDHVDVTHLLRMEYSLAGAGMIMVDDEGNNAIVSVPGIRKNTDLRRSETLH